jgi:hypothetical protein
MDNQYKISQAVQDLIALFKEQGVVDRLAVGKAEPKVKIHEAVGKMGYVYEKIRNTVDYQEEHLLRKNAIGRMLKRRIMTRARGADIALLLIQELIRAGYLKNDYFPVARIFEVENIINKYAALNQLTSRHPDPAQRNKIFNWIISVASYELEQYFTPSIKDDALVECMFKVIRPNLDLTEEIPNPEDRDIQIYIAIHRALIKSDQAMLRYHLVYYYAPEWRYITNSELPAFAQKLVTIMPRIDQQINNPMSDQLFRYTKKYSPLFSVLKDVLNQNKGQEEQIVSDRDKLAAAVREACQQRYLEAGRKLSRGVIRSIIYIFLTKTILAFVLELPYEAIIVKNVRLAPLAINVVFHPFLMFLIATSIRVPAEKNTQKIIQGIDEYVYDLPEKEILKRRVTPFRSGGILSIIFNFLYFLTFIITFGFIIWLLHALNFSLVSGLLFILFLCTIGFFGLRLRQNAKEMVVLDKKEGAFMVVFDFISLPVLRVGRWISRNTSKINIFMFIMDFIIEAPFKIIVETIEEWVAFQREKKEEVY